jgi:transcriptional regulator with XRE-family HTH domain
MDICALIGVNIRKLRHKKGLSQEEFAAEAGMDRSYLSEIETGRKNPSIIILDQIAQAFSIDIKIFFDGYKH